MASNKKSWRETFKDRPNLKKAVIAAGIAGGGLGVALLARKGLGKWAGASAGIGGGAGAGMFGGAFLERLKRERERVRESASTFASTGKDLARNLPVESFVQAGIDLPVNALEGALARQISSRTKNISSNLGGTIRAVQTAGTMKVARPVVELQGRLLGERSDSYVNPMDALESSLAAMPRELRSTASTIRWSDAMRTMSQKIKSLGSGNLTEEDLNEVLDSARIPMTVQNRLRLKQMAEQLSVFGSGGMMGTISKYI